MTDNQNRPCHSCTHGGNYCDKLDCFLGFLPAAAFTEEQNIKIFGKRHFGISVFSVIDYFGILLFTSRCFFFVFYFCPSGQLSEFRSHILVCSPPFAALHFWLQEYLFNRQQRKRNFCPAWLCFLCGELPLPPLLLYHQAHVRPWHWF